MTYYSIRAIGGRRVWNSRFLYYILLANIGICQSLKSINNIKSNGVVHSLRGNPCNLSELFNANNWFVAHSTASISTIKQCM